MKTNKLLSYCLIFIFLSCQEKKVEYELKYDNDFLNTMLEKGINNGDTIAYDKAFAYVMQNGGYTEFYYYALLMANKHNYNKAYHSLFILLTREGKKVNGIDIYSSDEKTQRLANYYLLKSYELGYKSAYPTLENIFGSNIPNSEHYLCEVIP